MSLKERANKLKKDLPAIGIALTKKETPLISKVLAAIALGYALSPLDIIPDFIPVLGLLDDLILLPLLIGLAIKFIPKDLLDLCRQEAAHRSLELGKKRRWYFALPVILLWAILIMMLVKRIVT